MTAPGQDGRERCATARIGDELGELGKHGRPKSALRRRMKSISEIASGSARPWCNRSSAACAPPDRRGGAGAPPPSGRWRGAGRLSARPPAPRRRRARTASGRAGEPLLRRPLHLRRSPAARQLGEAGHAFSVGGRILRRQRRRATAAAGGNTAAAALTMSQTISGDAAVTAQAAIRRPELRPPPFRRGHAQLLFRSSICFFGSSPSR